MLNDWKNEMFQGWKNWYTWNIALTLNNNRNYYGKIKDFRDRVKEGKVIPDYDNFIRVEKLTSCYTPDGVSFNDSRIDKVQLYKDCIAED